MGFGIIFLDMYHFSSSTLLSENWRKNCQKNGKIYRFFEEKVRQELMPKNWRWAGKLCLIRADEQCTNQLKFAKTNGGREGIRTLDRVFDPIHTFQACAFDHSATLPQTEPHSKLAQNADTLFWKHSSIKQLVIFFV